MSKEAAPLVGQLQTHRHSSIVVARLGGQDADRVARRRQSLKAEAIGRERMATGCCESSESSVFSKPRFITAPRGRSIASAGHPWSWARLRRVPRSSKECEVVR